MIEAELNGGPLIQGRVRVRGLHTRSPLSESERWL
jgi:hypothetical protein